MDDGHSVLTSAEWRGRIVAAQRRKRRRRRRRSLAVVLAVAALAALVVVIDVGPSEPVDAVDGGSSTTERAEPSTAVKSAERTTVPKPAPAATTTLPATTTTVPATTTTAPAPQPFVLPADCVPAGEEWLDVGIGPPLRRLVFGGADVALASQLDPSESPDALVTAVATSSDGSAVALVVHSAAYDWLVFGAAPAWTWTTVADAEEITRPAMTASGSRLAWVADGRLTIAAAATGWQPVPVAPPVEGGRPTFLRFVGDDRLVVPVEEPAAGTSLEFAALSDVWAYDIVAASWTALTAGEVDLDRWSLAVSPVAAADGSIFYVRRRGSTSDASAATTSELRRVTGAGGQVDDAAVAAVPPDALLVSVDAAGWTLWNVPDEQGRWHLVVRAADGITTALGCGRSHLGSTSRPLPLPGGVVLTPDVDGPDPFVVMEAGRAWVFTTNAMGNNVPVATLGPDGSTIVTDALLGLPDWAAPGYTWAPSAAAAEGGWTLWFTARDRLTGRQCIGAARSSEPQGPYEADHGPLLCDDDLGGSIDPSPVVAPDGRLTLLYKTDGNCCSMPTTIRAVVLDSYGTGLAGTPVELLREDTSWEGGVVEAPSMVFGPDGDWWLLYSANRWASSKYAVGAARCETPVGPCQKQTVPALDDDAYPGAGGAEFVAQTQLVVLHEWAPEGVGYKSGSHRRVRLGRVEQSCGRLTIRIIPDQGAADPNGVCD